MLPQHFDAIDKDDIERLVANNVAEGRTLDFKEELPGSSDNDKKEFLFDVSALANAQGGD